MTLAHRGRRPFYADLPVELDIVSGVACYSGIADKESRFRRDAVGPPNRRRQP